MFRFSSMTFLAVVLGVVQSSCSVSPTPYSEFELDLKASENLSEVTADQEEITKPIDLYEAMARALKYNLNYRVEAEQTLLRIADLDLAHYAQLPNAVVDAGYADRNNFSASSSFNLATNTPNFAESTSTDKELKTSELSFSWNILDFGLSYVRALQSADKVIISREMQRKSIHKLLEDVRNAYWRAVSYDRLVTRLKHLESRTNDALADSRALSDSGQTFPITALTQERELVEIKRAIKYLQRDIIDAKSQLASLMNVKPNTRFRLVVNSRPKIPIKLPMQLNEMMTSAIRDRPELRENWYQQRINMNEARAALLELLPGLQLYYEPNWDSNSFLLNNDWVSWGAKASWNLIKVFQYPAKRRVLTLQDDVLKTRALALTMAVMSQVHLSRLRFNHFRLELESAAEYRSVQNRLTQQLRDETAASRIGEQKLLKEELNALVAEAKYDIAYASLQSAYANVYASIGKDLYAEIDISSSVTEVTNALRQNRFYKNGNKFSFGWAPKISQLDTKF